MSKLRIALSKGSLLEPTIAGLAKAGFDVAPLRRESRQLRLVAEGGIEYLIARPADVPTYVERGAVDIGFVGSDILMENKYEVVELKDLAYGSCKFILAGQKKSTSPAPDPDAIMTIATKYPNITAEYLARCGRQAEIIKLYGSLELAPLAGLADQIIDLMSTGRTLSENGLEVIDEIADVSCLLIANYVSYKLKSSRIDELAQKVGLS